MEGLVIENISNLYKIKDTNNIEYEAIIRGKLKNIDMVPVVGDIVDFNILESISNGNTKNVAVIENIKNRKVYVKRPKMANINKIVFVLSSGSPKPDLFMLDKQLAFAEFLRINSIIVLNKIDLDEQNNFLKIKKLYESIGYKVIETQANNNIGIKELKDELLGNINAFAGNSGVGKSTLINAIFKDKVTQEGQISQKNKKGKNTTTVTKLYAIDEKTYIADTPGFSTFDISEIESKELCFNFKEFREYIENCKYLGCTHIKEDDCGVKKALYEGKICKNRYENYCKIYEELKEKESRKKW